MTTTTDTHDMPDDFGITEVHTFDGSPSDLCALWERRGKVVTLRFVARDGLGTAPHR